MTSYKTTCFFKLSFRWRTRSDQTSMGNRSTRTTRVPSSMWHLSSVRSRRNATMQPHRVAHVSLAKWMAWRTRVSQGTSSNAGFTSRTLRRWACRTPALTVFSSSLPSLASLRTGRSKNSNGVTKSSCVLVSTSTTRSMTAIEPCMASAVILSYNLHP